VRQEARGDFTVFPEPALLDSGNDICDIYATNLAAELMPLVRAFLEDMSKLFSNEKVHVHDSLWKLPQILRVPEIWNKKKQSTPERPCRRAWIISIPEKRELVTAAMLSSVVPVGSQEEESEPTEEDTDCSNQVLQRHVAWLKARKVQYAVEELADGSTLLRFRHCPLQEQGASGRSCLVACEQVGR
jgi:hypothetical protein